MEGTSYPQEEQYLSQLSLPFDFKIQCNKYHMSLSKSKAAPHKVTIREDREKAQSSLKVANDATIFSLCAFPISMIDNILPFLTPLNIKICHKSLTHELVVKAIINYFRQIMTEHAN